MEVTVVQGDLLDQDVDLYGRILQVSFVDLVRGDKTFASVDALITQMKLDCEAVRKILAVPEVSDLPLWKAQAAGEI